jgi:P2 family phage contractile tail tube protein
MVNDVLKDWVLFLDSGKLVGQVETFKGPALNVTLEEFRAAGMDAPIGIDMGMDRMEAEFTTAGLNRDVLERFGLRLGTRNVLKVRGAVQDTTTGLIKPVYHTLRGNITSIDQGEWKAGTRATLGVKMSLTAYELTHTLAGIPVIKIDVENYVRMINGVDQLALQRVVLGR